jgi:hypothetical protein
MQRSRLFFWLGLILPFLSGCIEEYDPDNLYDYVGEVSVSGWITDLPGEQTISLARATHYSLRYVDELGNCMVAVQDDQGYMFNYSEREEGQYVYTFSEGEVQVGRSYKLIIVTPEGKTYESEYEEMLPVPDINKIDYKLEYQDTREIGTVLPGVRFYSEFNGEGDYPVFYKLDIWETYEFHTPFSEIFVLNSGIMQPLHEDSVQQVCYLTEKVPDIMLISTRNLAEPKINELPLHFVSNQTQRLMYGYSPQLRLMSLTESAHTYWENQKKNLEESGGLFEKQPPSDISNISSLDDPDEKVLGFFGASSVSTTRIFVPSGLISEFDITPYCIPAEIRGTMWNRLYRDFENTYYFTYYPGYQGALALSMINRICFDCTEFGGSTTIIPDFWQQ